jgi:hypothetical protein
MTADGPAPAPHKGWFDTQTLVVLGGVATVLVGWGYVFSELQSDTNSNTAAVIELSSKLEKNDSATALLDTRMTALEAIAADAIMLRRELEGTVGSFRADIAVIKEILERMDEEERQP